MSASVRYRNWWLENFPRDEVLSIAKQIFGDGETSEPSAILASLRAERKP